MVDVWRVWSKPRIAAEWGEEYEGRAEEWWETFLDLVFVSAFTNGAAGFKKSLQKNSSYDLAQSVVDFGTQFTLFYTAWLQYTLFTARFIDTSLVHSVLMFTHLIGTSGMVVNTGSSDLRWGFAIGSIIQRTSLVCMLVIVYWLVPRARRQAQVDIVQTLPSVILLVCGIAVGASDGLLQGLLAGTAGYELLFPYIQTWAHFLADKGLPVNIDHLQNRLASLIMLVLGESVLSAVTSHHNVEDKSTLYYAAMTLSIAVNFGNALVYFAIVPPRKFNALRRSPFAGVGYMTTHWALGLAFLTLSVAVKLSTDVITDGEQTTLSSGYFLLFMSSLGACMAGTFVLRLLHWWRRQPAPGDSAEVRRVKYIWWAGHAAAAVLPPVVAGLTLCVQPAGINPFVALWEALACTLGYAVFESSLMHYLEHLGHHSTLQNMPSSEEPLLSAPLPAGVSPSRYDSSHEAQTAG
ncbi:Hypothetical Protein FCC1311_017572 [Hondaea fermentalgiana]|uniref:Uncharacterized protein n=1 Tax=Hondaea fermentalgiana TaxID=2315210 RepID=A0A2R5G6W6_9STRA|nr:Hypothetical Protein FCC1311_017572 [Hondaea fermentalgiana]|eukprot:GBG25538.1 Hypothetical Protein FCC1311_017572 [Hondaea fermentalgiana]